MNDKRRISLIQLRKLHGKTQAQIAGEIGVSKATYSAWETGRIEIGSKHLVTLSTCLNCTPDDILGYSRRANSSPLPIDSEELEMISLYRSLPPNIKNDILDIMRTTVKGWRLH